MIRAGERLPRADYTGGVPPKVTDSIRDLDVSWQTNGTISSESVQDPAI